MYPLRSIEALVICSAPRSIASSAARQVVGLDVASYDKVEADELLNNEATPAALNLGAVFDREAAHRGG